MKTAIPAVKPATKPFLAVLAISSLLLAGCGAPAEPTASSPAPAASATTAPAPAASAGTTPEETAAASPADTATPAPESSPTDTPPAESGSPTPTADEPSTPAAVSGYSFDIEVEYNRTGSLSYVGKFRIAGTLPKKLTFSTFNAGSKANKAKMTGIRSAPFDLVLNVTNLSNEPATFQTSLLRPEAVYSSSTLNKAGVRDCWQGGQGLPPLEYGKPEICWGPGVYAVASSAKSHDVYDYADTTKTLLQIYDDSNYSGTELQPGETTTITMHIALLGGSEATVPVTPLISKASAKKIIAALSKPLGWILETSIVEPEKVGKGCKGKGWTIPTCMWVSDGVKLKPKKV
jgi:hypothetical protein